MFNLQPKKHLFLNVYNVKSVHAKIFLKHAYVYIVTEYRALALARNDREQQVQSDWLTKLEIPGIFLASTVEMHCNSYFQQ